MTHKINKLLIANRGEIACRIIRTCKLNGIRTVAVYSDADSTALHVRLADEAIHIGPAPATESYLVGAKIIAAAKQTGADAIHPGYGFLSENPDFAKACIENGVIFIGPSPKAMQAMALKDAAKALMQKAGVPVIPGYHGDDQSNEHLIQEAKKIGLPVLIKAVAGGGGKGMRAVHAENEIAAALDGARREARNSFGNDRLLIEKLIEVPRHIEMQVFGDSHGNCVHLFERDCSLQRRHQKVIEEAPAPGMSEALRAKMGDAAVKAAQAIKYQGAGTIEFIVDVANGLEHAPFYFMEMNTRLQVEHPVTEMITGQDLVAWQIAVAEGKPLPLTQPEINARMLGHALEVRLYAEDPDGGFLPATGEIRLFNPSLNTLPNTRVEAGITAGDSIGIHYDPMIAKLVAWGSSRDEALSTLLQLIAETPIAGLKTNRDFLIRCLIHSDFKSANLDTGFIGRNMPALLAESSPPSDIYALAALALIANRRRKKARNPWYTGDCFQLNLPAKETITFTGTGGKNIPVRIVHTMPNYEITVAGSAALTAESVTVVDSLLEATLRDQRVRCQLDISADTVTIITASATYSIPIFQAVTSEGSGHSGNGQITAPMPGKILSVLVQNGASVKAGSPLLVLEAMKMEHTLRAPCEGTAQGLCVHEGDQVTHGTLLLTIEDSASKRKED